MEIGAVLREARERAGLSARELARRAGTSHATLLAYESERIDPGTKVAERILNAAGFHLRFTLNANVLTTSRRPAGDELADILDLAEHLPHQPRSRHLNAPVFPGPR